MIQDVYPIEREGKELVFFFKSNNATGTNPVGKGVRYEKMMKYGMPYYNLAFGDKDKTNGIIYDDVVTNNGDMRKVLKTVISTMKIFFTEKPGEIIHIEGSDPIRNKFYQKIIRDYEEIISKNFTIMGYKANNLESFKRGLDYEFIVVDVQKKSEHDLPDQE